MKHTPSDAELNSLQDGVIGFVLSCREVRLRKGRIIMRHPVYFGPSQIWTELPLKFLTQRKIQIIFDAYIPFLSLAKIIR